MQMHEIAHYGRWYPYEKRIFPYWWYDLYSDQVINIDALSQYMGLNDISEINIEDCKKTLEKFLFFN